jgi:hypothetical protein
MTQILFVILLSLFLTSSVLAAGNCTTKFLALPVKNNTLGDGVALERGLSVVLGGQPQGMRRNLQQCFVSD